MPIAPAPPDCPTCIEEPGVPPVTAAPGRVVYAPDFGWDAGANSITELSGDVILSFTAEQVVGSLVGLRTARPFVNNFPSYYHAILLLSVGTNNVYSVMEQGTTITVPTVRTLSNTDDEGNPADAFDIIRTGVRVVYQINGVPFYFSTALTSAPLIVSACLYCPGDTIG